MPMASEASPTPASPALPHWESAPSGSSPSDFPPEHYERTWDNRFTVEDLNEIGRRGLGLA